jgi:hypothetical protein
MYVIIPTATQSSLDKLNLKGGWKVLYLNGVSDKVKEKSPPQSLKTRAIKYMCWGCPQKQLIRKELKFELGCLLGVLSFEGKSIQYLHFFFNLLNTKNKGFWKFLEWVNSWHKSLKCELG